MKSSFKTCDAGHFYPSSKDSCPYCSGGDGLGRTEFTTPINEQPTVEKGNNFGGGGGGDKTEIIGNKNSGSGGGKGFGSKVEETAKIGNNFNNLNNLNNSDKTGIYRPETEVKDGGKTSENKGPQINARKLVGWMVSYSLNEFGIDFRLYEGQNTIGRDINSTIRITDDNLISSKHGTILFRNGSLYYKDEMSTNPSFLNEYEIMPGETVKIKDGDSLKIGKNDFILRLSIIA
jgi:hypothetical protein